jgi:hypothetical protein
MSSLAHRNLIIGVGALIGVAAGLLYWKYVGCNSGGCAIGSNPVFSATYGALLFGLSASEISKFNNKKTKH